MKIFIIQRNHEGISRYQNGGADVRIIDPLLIGTDSVRGFPLADRVFVSRELNTEEQTKALRYGYEITGYKEKNLNRVALI